MSFLQITRTSLGRRFLLTYTPPWCQWRSHSLLSAFPKSSPHLNTPGPLNPYRLYASKATTKSKSKSKETSKETSKEKEKQNATSKLKAKSTSTLIPGSQKRILDDAMRAEYEAAESSMQASVNWFRKECAASESRAAGRVTPALLSPVRVKLPDRPTPMKLEELATVGVREGSTLLVTLFDEHTVKHVEAALYTSGIPGVVPHRQDGRTIKVPIPKPTVEARSTLYAAAKRKSEEIRVQIRKQHSTSAKRAKCEKHSVEAEEFQKLTDKHIKEVDEILANLQKAMGAK